jgi:nucleotide-binding universal stress UspA family protein
VRQANKERADVIVLGTRGLSDVRGFLLGSVARKVVSLASRPVLIVKRPLSELRRVVVAVDGSQHSEAARRFLREHLLPESAHVTVLAIAQPIVDVLAASVLPLTQLARLSKPVEDEARQLVAKCRAEFLREGFEVTTDVVSGHPVLSILQYLERTHADLVVMGSRGLTGTERLVLGSVSEGVLQHAPCAVLIVPGNARKR